MRPSLITLAAVALFAILTATPYRWTHTLGPGCYWRPGPFALLGRAIPSPTDQAAQEACLERRGLKSLGPVKLLLTRWPDEHRHPLPSAPHPADLQARAGR